MTSKPPSSGMSVTVEAGSARGDEAGAHDLKPDKESNGNSAEDNVKRGFFQRLKDMLSFRKNVSLRQDLEVVLGQGDADLTFTPEERAMLSNILALREVRADDVMVPRADIDAVDATISLGELIFLFEESRHSRMPVYRETLDDPIGMVHVKDLMAFVMEQAEKNPKDDNGARRNDIVDYDLSNVDLAIPLNKAKILRPVLFIPPSMPAFDIFAKMQATRSQMALVIDEYGGTDGLVSMEDVVEAIVGDIEDEHDDEAGPQIVKVAENRWTADARASLDDVCEALGISLDISADGDDVDTIGGLLFTELGRIPVRGEVVRALEDYDLEIIEADPRRIRKVRIVKAKLPAKRRKKRAAEPQGGSDRLPAEKSES